MLVERGKRAGGGGRWGGRRADGGVMKERMHNCKQFAEKIYMVHASDEFATALLHM